MPQKRLPRTKADALDIDLEKAALSPTDTAMTLSTYDHYPTPSDYTFSLDSPKDLPSPTISEDDSAAHIVISDAHPPSRPPTPPIVAQSVFPPPPAYHRPFSPPTVCPVDVTRLEGLHAAITVTVKTE